jgi:16S rRNA processing protein RimM
MPEEMSRVTIATIGRPHGTRGEVRVFPINHDSDSLREGVTVYLTGRGEEKVLEIESARRANKFFIVRFQGLNHRDQVDALKHLQVEIGTEDLPDLEEDEFYHRDLLGAPVYVALEEDGELPEDPTPIGQVDRFFETGANDVLVVALTEGGSLLVPVVEHAISFIDVDERVIVLQPLELWAPQ